MKRRFDWDPEKAKKNLAKHGIAFEVAIDVFDDSDAFNDEDKRFDYGEVRKQTTGRAGDTIIAVIYTERGDLTRLISARKANRRERRKYGRPRS